MFEENSFMSLVTCYFDPTSQHVLKTPKILPCCGNTACLDCISRHINQTREFTCPYANCTRKILLISNPNDLLDNKIVDLAIEKNLDSISRQLLDSLKLKYYSLTDSQNDTLGQIDKESDAIESCIKRRIDLLIAEIKNIENQLLEELRLHKEKSIREYKSNIQTDAVKQKFLQILNTHFELVKNSKFIEFKENMYKCQEFLIELNRMDSNVTNDFKRVNFLPNVWLPNANFIGKLVKQEIAQETHFNIKDNSFNHKYISYDGIKQISKLIKLSSRFFVLFGTEDKQTSSFVLLNEDLSLNKRIASIGSRKFKNLIDMCSDDEECVFICESDQIIVTNFEFSSIRRYISRKKNDESKAFVGVFFDCGRLYVLDKDARVFVHSKDGNQIRTLKLFKSSDSNEDLVSSQSLNPISICVHLNDICVLMNFNDLFIYNLDGYLRQIIKSQDLNSICLNSKGLFALQSLGSLVQYCYDDNKKIYELKSSVKVSASNDCFSGFCMFNDKFLLSSIFNGNICIVNEFV